MKTTILKSDPVGIQLDCLTFGSYFILTTGDENVYRLPVDIDIRCTNVDGDCVIIDISQGKISILEWKTLVIPVNPTRGMDFELEDICS